MQLASTSRAVDTDTDRSDNGKTSRPGTWTMAEATMKGTTMMNSALLRRLYGLENMVIASCVPIYRRVHGMMRWAREKHT